MPAKPTTVCPDRLFPTLRCVDAAAALAQCLSTVARGKKTTPDLACTGLRVALYYDGQHHDGDDQTDTDFRLFQQIKDPG
jgi:hypothetical protein